MNCLVCKKYNINLVAPHIFHCGECGSYFRDKDIVYQEVYINTNYHFDPDWLKIEQKGKVLYLNDDIKKDDKKIIEVGACWGDLIANLETDAKLYSSDIISLLHDEYKSKVTEIVETFENIPEEKYDVVIMNNVIEHLNNPIDVIKKINRLLTKKGRFVFFTEDADNQLFALLNMTLHQEHRFIIGKKGVEQLCLAGGFDCVKYYNLFFNNSIYVVLEKTS